MISQPGLTRSMQRLEDDLGLSLFDRKKNKIELNENGKLAVEFSQKLLAEREEMIKELTKLSQNHISFGRLRESRAAQTASAKPLLRCRQG